MIFWIYCLNPRNIPKTKNICDRKYVPQWNFLHPNSDSDTSYFSDVILQCQEKFFSLPLPQQQDSVVTLLTDSVSVSAADVMADGATDEEKESDA